MTEPLLTVSGLHVAYRGVEAVGGVDFSIDPGEVVAVVGESGSGKSTTAHAILGLLPAGGSITSGSVSFDGIELAGARDRVLRGVRGAGIGLIPQDPGVSLNPVQRVGDQVAEVLRTHGLASRRSAGLDAIDVLDRAGVPDAARRARQYPHELSGGLRQRVLIAIAVAARPRLIIADEPTSALDVTVQRVILDHLASLTSELGTAMLLVTHDLAVAADRADRIAVMSQGQLVEVGAVSDVLTSPRDPYTKRLLAAAPSWSNPTQPAPIAQDAPIVLSARNLVKDFAGIRAVDDVSFDIAAGETLALVGESGSGKSTTARLAVRLTEPTSGQILLDDVDITTVKGRALREVRRRAQLVYQNPYASLDPRHDLAAIITEPLRAFGIGSRRERVESARDLLDAVRLPGEWLSRKPAELSGGQRQRVAIARALALSPDIVVCDEPTSALDVSVQAQVLDLLVQLQRDRGTAYLFITHDLAIVRSIAHRIAVMRNGQLVETGSTGTVFDNPQHEYTRMLIDSVPGHLVS